MPLYRIVGPKKLMVSSVQTLLTVPGQPAYGTHTAPGNVWVEPGQVIELSEADAAALGERVALVNV